MSPCPSQVSLSCFKSHQRPVAHPLHILLPHPVLQESLRPQASARLYPLLRTVLALAEFCASFRPQLTFLLLWEVVRPPLERSSLPLWPPTTRHVPISLIALGYHCCILHPIRSCSSQKLGHPGPFCVPRDNLLKGSVTI